MSSYASEWPDYADTLPDGTEIFSGSIVRPGAVAGQRILTDTKHIPHIPVQQVELIEPDGPLADFLEITVPDVTARTGSVIIVNPVVTGGSPPYTFSYQGIPEVAGDPGHSQARVTVTDSQDGSVTTSVAITVVT